jgi:transcriptional regulator with XRE-family HTH domain
MRTAQYLDAAKKALQITSDYALAQRLGIYHSNVSNWRAGRNFPDRAMCRELAGIVGVEPVQLIADVELERAIKHRNAEERKLWERIRAAVAVIAGAAIGAALLYVLMDARGAFDIAGFSLAFPMTGDALAFATGIHIVRLPRGLALRVVVALGLILSAAGRCSFRASARSAFAFAARRIVLCRGQRRRTWWA